MIDRDLATMNVIGIVFPTSINRLFRFHNEKILGQNTNNMWKKDIQDELIDVWKNIVYSTNVDECNHHLQYFELVSTDIIIFIDYVKDL